MIHYEAYDMFNGKRDTVYKQSLDAYLAVYHFVDSVHAILEVCLQIKDTYHLLLIIYKSE